MCVQGSFDQLLRLDGIDGKRIAVSGLGPAGLIAVQMARAYGAREVIGIDPLHERRELANNLGTEQVLSPDEASLPASRLIENSFDSALDTTGLKKSIEKLMQGTNGAVAIFGVLREQVMFGPDQWWGGFALLGYGSHERSQAEKALQLIKDGSLDLSLLVTHKLPLTRYAEGIDLLRRQKAIKILFDPWDE
jgi:threonine dehydrogenase-like Zn-dependent dehydrogenase